MFGWKIYLLKYFVYLTNEKTYGDRGPCIKGTASLSTNVPYPRR